jgi:hypothetical protein
MEGNVMRSKCSTRVHLILASLLLLWGGSFRASHAVPPTVTISGLTVNGQPRACGSTTPITGGSTVCVLFTTNQSGFAEVFLSPNNVRVCAGNVTPGPTWRCCFTFSSTPITGNRSLTVTVTNSANETGSASCGFVVGSGSQTQLTGTIRTNKNQSATCNPNVTYFIGEQISFIVTSSLPAHATVRLTKPGGSPMVIFDGDVSAGTTTVTSGTVGSPTGQRTLNLTLTSGSMTATDTCGYNVASGALAPTGP